LSKDRDEALAEIYRRGGRMRWRARIQVASIGVVAVLAAMGLVAAGHHDGTAHRTVVADGRSPQSHSPAAGTLSASDGSSSSDPQSGDDTPTTKASKHSKHADDGSSTTVKAGARSADGTTSTTLECHNSTDPACGPFHYDPPLPKNRPTQIKITPDTATPVAGEPVTFTVTVDDPDGQGPGRCGEFDADVTKVEPTTTTALQPASACTMAASADPAASHGYGAWDPPSTVPGHVVTTYTVTYQASGPHTVSYSTFDVGQCGDKGCPHADEELTLNVQPDSTTTTAKPTAKRG
jgi:hypothetical protein